MLDAFDFTIFLLQMAAIGEEFGVSVTKAIHPARPDGSANGL
jgi:hypothetical protein